MAKALLLIMLTVVACKKEQVSFSANGTIVKENVDGCGWLIKLDNNQILEPTYLSSFNTVTIQDGQKVILIYKEIQNTQSICMMGEMVKFNQYF